MILLFYVLWAALGLLFGLLLYASALAVVLALSGQRGASAATAVAIVMDVILIIIFFVWPFGLAYALRFFIVDCIFFGCMALAVVVLSISSLVGGESPLEIAEEGPFPLATT